MKLHRPFSFTLTFIALSILLVSVAGASVTQQVSIPNDDCPAHSANSYWCVVPSGSAENGADVLNGVSAVDYNDIWAAGMQLTNQDTLEPMIKFWNGATWSKQSAAVPDDNIFSGFNAVVASSTENVWAVGDAIQNDRDCHDCTLVEHRNGTGWSIIDSDNPSHNNVLNAVTSLKYNDEVLVAGTSVDTSYNGGETLVERCSSSGCTMENTPNHEDDYSALTGVVVYSTNSAAHAWADEAWAVGYYSPGSVAIQCNRELAADCRPLFLYGTCSSATSDFSWSVSSAVETMTVSSFLNSVDIFAPKDIWAVGGYSDGQRIRSLIMHWDGDEWTKAQDGDEESPGTYSELHSVFVTSERDVLAVGKYSSVCSPLSPQGVNCVIPTPSPTWGWDDDPYYQGMTPAPTEPTKFSPQDLDRPYIGPPQPPAGARTLILHWHGSSLDDIGGQFWDQVGSPNPGGVGNQLLGVTAATSARAVTSVWAVGSYSDELGFSADTLVENISSPTAPFPSTNYFVETADTDRHYDAGCNSGNRWEHGVIVLDYGQPQDFGNGKFGTVLLDRQTSVATGDIEVNVESFIDGYHDGRFGTNRRRCPSEPDPDYQSITITVGINNDDTNDQAALTPQHAHAWADMIENINQYVSAQGYSEIRVVAGIDAEDGFSSFSEAALWTVNYTAYSRFPSLQFWQHRQLPL